jgi:hypothetical protein
MISWSQYVKDFTELYDSLKTELLETGCVECGPFLQPKERKYPASAPFGVDWAVIYQDGHYFRVKESFNRMGRPQAGLGKREHFSYHYGVAHTDQDADGFPLTQDPATPPAHLRVDVDGRLDPHIHILTEDHIPQARVSGYSIANADIETFLQAVAKHRKDGTPVHELLGIKVTT